jgi:hypothetical protein
MEKMIIQFSNFLLEEYLAEAASSSVSNDDKGKLHELLLAKHLHPTGNLPEHFRATSEESKTKGHAGTPSEVHDRIAERIGEEAYNEIDQHAKSTAAAVKKNLKDRGVLDKDTTIGNVHWTSNRDTAKKPGDHETLTGVKDVNSNADMMLTLHRHGKIVGYHGISAKYGSLKKPNYKNPGAATLEDMAGLRKGRIEEIMQPHHNLMEKIGYHGSAEQRKRQYKADALIAKEGVDKVREIAAKVTKIKAKVDSKKPLSKEEVELHKNHKEELPYLKQFLDAHESHADKEYFVQSAVDRVKMAETSKKQHLNMVAKELQHGLMHKIGQEGDYDPKKVGKQLWELLRSHVSPTTVIPHTVAHSWVQEDGKSEPIVKNMKNIADDHLHHFTGLHVANDVKSGIVIRGTHKATGEIRNVAQYGLKTQSGPHSSVVSTLTL